MQWLPQRLWLPRRAVVESKDADAAEQPGAADDDAVSLLDQPSEIIIKNTGSVARDHLANERTFLAWLRTALSSVALGLALAKFTDGLASTVGGTFFFSIGMVTLAYTGHRYYSVEGALARGEYVLPRNEINTMLLISCLGTLVCVAFVALTPDLHLVSTSSEVEVKPAVVVAGATLSTSLRR